MVRTLLDRTARKLHQCNSWWKQEQYAQLIQINEGQGRWTAFHSAPTITDDMLKHAQLIDTQTFLLSTVDCNHDLQRGFTIAVERLQCMEK